MTLKFGLQYPALVSLSLFTACAPAVNSVSSKPFSSPKVIGTVDTFDGPAYLERAASTGDLEISFRDTDARLRLRGFREARFEGAWNLGNESVAAISGSTDTCPLSYMYLVVNAPAAALIQFGECNTTLTFRSTGREVIATSRQDNAGRASTYLYSGGRFQNQGAPSRAVTNSTVTNRSQTARTTDAPTARTQSPAGHPPVNAPARSPATRSAADLFGSLTSPLPPAVAPGRLAPAVSSEVPRAATVGPTTTIPNRAPAVIRLDD